MVALIKQLMKLIRKWELLVVVSEMKGARTRLRGLDGIKKITELRVLLVTMF